MEEEDKDVEIGVIVPPPSPLSRTIFMSNSGKTLLVSSPTSNKKKKKSSDDSMKSYSFNNIYPNRSFDTDDASLPSNTYKALVVSSSAKSLALSDSCKSVALSESGKQIDQKKKYVKQVTGKHKDTELHLAAQKGDIKVVKDILEEIDAQMTGTSGAEFDVKLTQIRLAIVNEVNELGETPLFRAAEKGHLDVVKALLPFTTSEAISTKNQVGITALHVAASQGHEAIVQLLLDQDPELCNTVGQSNLTPLISAAIRGHLGVVKVLLSQNCNLLEMPKSNGKNALHLSARQGHVDIVKALLKGEPKLARRTDKKGQTALHMAVKGHSAQVVRLLLRADPSIIMLLDKFGNAALHVATRKKRVEIVNELLLLSETDVNALTRDHKTAMDIVEGLPLSIESSEIKGCLMRHGGVKADELNQLPRDDLRKTVTEIQKDVHTQLEQTRRTNDNVNGIAKELKKLHRDGINNATNSVTVVAVLFATVAFAAVFTVPGGDYDSGVAVVAGNISFKIFFVFNAIALFTSLSVVVVQITLVRGETKSERKVVEVINKLMWMASVCTSVSFISSSYIVVGRHHSWAAIFVTILGAGVMAGVLGTMTYYVVKYKKIRKVRKKEKSSMNMCHVLHDIDAFSEDSAVNAIYAI